MLRRGTLVVLLAVALVGVGTPGWADDPIGPIDCNRTPNDPYCDVLAPDPGAPGGPGGGGGVQPCRGPSGAVVACFVDGRGWLWADDCYYLRGNLADPPPTTEAGAWYLRSCLQVDGSIGPSSWMWVPLSVQARISLPSVLGRLAVSRLRLALPVIRVNPVPPTPQVVQVPTWLWLEAASWGQRSATAAVPGLSVTATATPVRVDWVTGDGARVTCAGPGTPWREGMNPAARPPCGHTYTVASATAEQPHRTYTVQATVSWQVRWAGGGASGGVPDMQTTAATALLVVRAGGINTTGAAR